MSRSQTAQELDRGGFGSGSNQILEILKRTQRVLLLSVRKIGSEAPSTAFSAVE